MQPIGMGCIFALLRPPPPFMRFAQKGEDDLRALPQATC